MTRRKQVDVFGDDEPTTAQLAQEADKAARAEAPAPAPKGKKAARVPERITGMATGADVLLHPLVPRLEVVPYPPPALKKARFKLAQVSANLDENARAGYDPAALTELAESIRTHGLLQPPIVEMRDGVPVLVAGFRRFLALLTLGTEETDFTIVEPKNEGDRAIFNLIENIKRTDLHPCETARMLARIQIGENASAPALAEITGMSKATVNRLLSLNRLEPSIWAQVAARDPAQHAGLMSVCYRMASTDHKTQLKMWASWCDPGTVDPVTLHATAPSSTDDDGDSESSEGDQLDDDGADAEEKPAPPKRPSSKQIDLAIARIKKDKTVDAAYRQGVVYALRWVLGERKTPPVALE
jgi:ParB/RepB/Spo0J family partition protein